MSHQRWSMAASSTSIGRDLVITSFVVTPKQSRTIARLADRLRMGEDELEETSAHGQAGWTPADAASQ